MAIFGQVCHDLGSSFPWGGVGGQVEVGIEEERRKISRLLSFFKVVHQSGFTVDESQRLNG